MNVPEAPSNVGVVIVSHAPTSPAAPLRRTFDLQDERRRDAGRI